MDFKFLADRHTISNLEKIQGTASMKLWILKDNPRKPRKGDLIIVKTGLKRVMFKVLYSSDGMWHPLLDTEDVSSRLNYATINECRVTPCKKIKGLAFEVKYYSLHLERHQEHFTHGCVIS